MNVYTDPELLQADDALARLARFDDGGEAFAVVATGTYGDTEKDTEAGGLQRLAVSPDVKASSGGSDQDHSQIEEKREAVTGEVTACHKIEKAPQVGLEPTTFRLTAGCSTIELPRNRAAVWRRTEQCSLGEKRVKAMPMTTDVTNHRPIRSRS